MIDLEVSVFSYDAKEEKSEKIGGGVLKLDPEHLEKRLNVKDAKGADVGEVFIDFKISPKELYHASKELSKIVHKSTLFSHSI